MVFSNFYTLAQEGGLMAVILILLLLDIFAKEGARQWFAPVACTLMALQVAAGFLVPMPTGTAFGGMYLSSPMTVMMKNILTVGALVMFLQAKEWLRSADTVQREGEFYVLSATTLLGMYLMISATNMMLLYIGIELTSLPMACLAAYDKFKEKSAEAGAKYILIAVLSSGVMLFGLSFLYGATGTMYFSDMAAAITSPLTGYSPLVIVGLVFFLAGLGFKISLVPFHLWTADVYQGSPTSVAAYLSVVSKAAAVFTLAIVLLRVFAPVWIVWHHVLWALSVVTIVVGNLFALRQKELKRFFAFSSISQAGYIMLGIIGGGGQGMTAIIYFALVYLFSNFAVFGVISAVENRSGRTDMAALNGLYKTNPMLALVMTLAVFSLAGIPPFAGFFSKFFIFAAAAAKGEYILVFIALVNTVVSLYYYLLVVRAMFIHSEGGIEGRVRSDRYLGLSLVLCTAGILLVGIISAIYTNINTLTAGL